MTKMAILRECTMLTMPGASFKCPDLKVDNMQNNTQ